MDKLLRLLYLAALIGIVTSAVCIVGCGDDNKTVTGPEPIHYDDYIVYVGAYGITMISQDLTDEQIIVPGTADALLSPIWSPSKTEVVYVRINGSGKKQIELYRNDGSIDTLAMGMLGKAPWSPDGNKIAFARNDTVFVLSTRGSQPVRLMASAGDASFFDNNHVMCYNFSGYWSEGSIYKISISDTTATKLFPQSQAGSALLRCPRVIPGDNSVAFGMLGDDNYSKRWNDFLKVNADGSDVTTITRIYTIWGMMIMPKEMDISGNGDFILLVHNEEHFNRHAYEIYIPSGEYTMVDAVECSSDIRSIDYSPDSRDFVFEKESGGIAIFDRSEGQAINVAPSGKHPNW